MLITGVNNEQTSPISCGFVCMSGVAVDVLPGSIIDGSGDARHPPLHRIDSGRKLGTSHTTNSAMGRVILANNVGKFICRYLHWLALGRLRYPAALASIGFNAASPH